MRRTICEQRLLCSAAMALLVAASYGIGGCDRDDAASERTRPPVPLAAPSSLTLPKPDFAANAEVHQVGQSAVAPNFKMTVEKVKECELEEYFRPKTGNVKLGIEVTIEAQGEHSVPVNPFYAKLTDAEGAVYTTTLAGCTPTLKSRRLESEEKATGYITFEIPATATGLRMKYAPFIVGGREQPLIFDLGR